MPLIKRVQSVFLFPDGNLAVFGVDDQQIGELQGQYSIERHQRILLEALDNCSIKGFGILPDGFNKTANDWANYFRKQNLSFEEIEQI